MNNNRFNGFNQIHKGLRALLYDTALALQFTDFSDPSAAELSFSKVEISLWLFEGHAHTEDDHFFPKVKKFAAAMIAELENEHETDHQLCQLLRNSMEEYRMAGDDTERIMAGTAVFLAFNDFIAFNLTHMNREETLVNKVIWDNYTDGEIHQMIADAIKSIPAHKTEVYSRWMMRGLGNHEITAWLAGVKATAPGFVFDDLCTLAAEELSTARWQTILATLRNTGPVTKNILAEA